MALIETEIKFRVADIAALEQQLRSIGFTLLTPRTFESNTLYDTPERTLRSKQQILRIRQYGERWVVTHKRVPLSMTKSDANEGRHKHREETETSLGDGTVLAEIFTHLGLLPSFRYEKWRTEWSDNIGHCVIDETPIGIYAELEGTSDWIDAVSAKLGLAPTDCLTLSYGRLFEAWRLETGSTAEHMTFDAVAKKIKIN
jgi:adenylate cyclase class 2